jgi:hypothetical protein
MKIIKEIKEQYAYLWWWMLSQGTVLAAVIVNLFSATLFAIMMAILHFFVKWYDKFR